MKKEKGNKKGKLFIFEGVDSSGKETQAKLLYNNLLAEGKNVRLISFPDYTSDSSALVKMYLAGDFGENADDVNVYAASTFYAVDRFASYNTKWKKFYEDGDIIIADRYTTSNMVHQAAKINNEKEKDEFLDWLWNLEFELYGLPVPDKVFFLDVKPETSQRLMESRLNKITNKEEKDIHESNKEYLNKSYNNAKYVADKYDWAKIDCNSGDGIKSIEEIQEKIREELLKITTRE